MITSGLHDCVMINYDASTADQRPVCTAVSAKAPV